MLVSKSSPVSVEWSDVVSANWVQDDDVEDDEVKDTTGSWLGEKGELTEFFRIFRGSTDPIEILRDIVLLVLYDSYQITRLCTSEK